MDLDDLQTDLDKRQWTDTPDQLPRNSWTLMVTHGFSGDKRMEGRMLTRTLERYGVSIDSFSRVPRRGYVPLVPSEEQQRG